MLKWQEREIYIFELMCHILFIKDMLMMGYLTIFQRFATTFQRSSNLSKGHMNIAEQRLSTRLLVGHGKKSNFTGFSETNWRKKWLISQEIHRNFLDKFCWKNWQIL